MMLFSIPRAFDTADGPQTTRVTIVTKSLADRLWPNENPVGKSLWDENNHMVIVGVVPDMVYTTTVERERLPTYTRRPLGAVALMLAVLGLYWVMAHAAT